MSNFPENNKNEEKKLNTEDVEISNASEEMKKASEDEESTVFSNPEEHSKKAEKVQPKKRIRSVVAAILAFAVLSAGTAAIIKIIPEKKNPTVSQAESKVEVLDIDVKTVQSVEVKNSVGTFSFLPIKPEQSGSQSENANKEIKWTVDGTESKYTSSATISKLVANASQIDAIREISGRTPESCGFDNPTYKVTVNTEKGNHVIEYGNKSADKLGYYVRVSDKDKIYLCSAENADQFKFELIDLADKTSFTGVKITDDIKSYADKGILASFDKITVSGKNFPDTVVIEPNKDKSDNRLYFDTVITAPHLRQAENFDVLLNAFANGISVTGAYTFDVTPESLKKYGLDNPYITMTVYVGNHTLTYKIAKVDDENCAVIDDNSYMIRKVPVKNIEFLEIKPENLYGRMVFLKMITAVKNFEITIKDKTYSFDISYDEKNEEDKYNIKYNGEKIISKYFQNFYQNFANITYMDFYSEGKTDNPTVKIVIKSGENTVDTIEYTEDSATRYTCTINGNVLGRVSADDISHLMKDVITVSQNKDPKE